MAKKGKDGLTAEQRKRLLRYNGIGAVVAVIVLALFMVHYQMTALSRGADPGPKVYRSGTATVSDCQRQASTLWTMYRCRADNVVWTTLGPDEPGRNVDLGTATDAVSVWAHEPVGGTVEIESHATQDREATTDVYKNHEIVMPVGQYKWDDTPYFLIYLGAMFASFLAIVWVFQLIGRRRVLRAPASGPRRP